MRFLIVAAIGLLAVFVAGCGSGLDLTDVTTRAIEATTGVQSYRLTALDSSALDGDTAASTLQSSFVAPDRYHAIVAADGDWFETVSVGEQAYGRSSAMPEWSELPSEYQDPSTGAAIFTEAILVRLDAFLEPLTLLVNLQQLPDDVVDGADVWHYRAQVDMDAYADRLQEKAREQDPTVPQEVLEDLERMRRGTMILEIWVEKDSYLIRQLKSETRFMVEDPQAGEERPLVGNSSVRLYDFNKPITIELPPQR